MKVNVYTTPLCPWCQKTKEFLKKHRVKFKEIDIEKDPKEAEEMVKKSGQHSVPVVEINGTIIIGYDEESMKKVLKIK
jgi:glutaredoxin-like YruB-family protein